MQIKGFNLYDPHCFYVCKVYVCQKYGVWSCVPKKQWGDLLLTLESNSTHTLILGR
jgi:hypothetical protein